MNSHASLSALISSHKVSVPSVHETSCPRNFHETSTKLHETPSGFSFLKNRRAKASLITATGVWWRGAVSSSEFVTFLTSVVVCGRKASQSICQTGIAGVLRLRAIKPSLCDRSAKRFAQDDDFVGELEIKLNKADWISRKHTGSFGTGELTAHRSALHVREFQDWRWRIRRHDTDSPEETGQRSACRRA